MTERSITPDRLASALDAAPAGLKVLSLDCFDTLIWRNTHAPRDVFAELFSDTAGVYHRMWSEEAARERAMVRHERSEITIAEIYDGLLEDADPAERADAIARELAAEARHTFAFAPTVALMRAAKARGMKVVVVSDIYLSRDHLEALIRSAAGDEVLGLIDRIFCSSEYGVTKSTGLFRDVLRELAVPAGAVLHLGDNRVADYEAPIATGVKAIHLEQFDEATTQRLRLEAAVRAIIEPAGMAAQAIRQPHRAQIAMVGADVSPAPRFGYATLGPILHGFARWVKDEAKALRQHTDGRVRLVFLLRDGHLPRRVYEAIADADGPAVSSLELSRFTATAAAMTEAEKIRRFVESELTITRQDVIARQLLFDRDEVKRLVRDAGGSSAAFAEAVLAPKSIERIVARSTAFAARLIKYVAKETGARAGDTLALVDLGYNGTAQNQIAPLFETALKVKVAGLYLLLRAQERTRHDKRGFIGPDHYDFTTLSGLSTNVSVLEQLCTVAQGSVVDYTADGKSVRAKVSVKGRQSAVREAIGEACVDYARSYGQAFVRPPASDDADASRQAAAAAMARLMFLPTKDEIDVLKDFEHDVNLGTEDMLKLFDADRGAEGLRQSGLYYLKNADRMYLPAEIRDEGLPLSLALLTQRRFGLQLRYADFLHKPTMIPIMVAGGGSVELTQVEAYATHDGYFRATAPVGDCRFAIGLQFGKLYAFVQIEAVSFAPLQDLEAKVGHALAPPIPAQRLYEGMSEAAPGLFRCDDENAFMMVPPPARADDRPMVLNVIFRPIAERAPSAGQVVAA
ncbi:MAG: hypothetical protein Q8M88_07435 [Phenylobacterium sp.]|uniref:HAD family hydrolase n=1 Tax=Phenylobacterium sp. TaxID=1871053 RepID=UPI002736B8D4|nr:HAD family hydrolase [Phenylobacterium sp.]MDP3174250.1 hypothetical protein [Phenylobacterium sp.]